MRTTRLIAVLLAALGSAAGCLGADAPAAPEDYHEQRRDAEVHNQEWSECTYMWLSFTWPGPTNPCGPPAAWTQPTFAIQTNTNYLYFECERSSWLEFERPIKMLWEVNRNFVADNNCTSGDNFPASLVEAVYLEDTEIAQSLTDQYGLNTQVATMSLETQLASQPMQARIDWRVGGHAPSTATHVFEGDLRRSSPDTESWVWESGDGIHVLAISTQSFYYDPPAFVATAEVSEPMMVDGTIADVPVIQAGFQQNATLSAALTVYQDKLCEQPL